MASILLGVIAAFAWGIHDLCVRYVSQNTGIFPSIMTVLITGTIFCLPFAVLFGDWANLTPQNAVLSLLSGVVFGAAGLALYKAFSIGPVKLVAPIIAAYPVLSVGWAVAQGKPIGIGQWMAVLVIIAGVAIVAALSDDEGDRTDRKSAITWSIAAGVGFALTFALGQAASANGAEIAVILLAHLASIAAVGIAALYLKIDVRPERKQIWLLALMGALDTLALGVVLFAGTTQNPEFTSVVSSTFGLITVLLAWLFLREPMTLPQWGGVLGVFAAIVYLGL